jgi:hypothetical protein
VFARYVRSIVAHLDSWFSFLFFSLIFLKPFKTQQQKQRKEINFQINFTLTVFERLYECVCEFK